MSNPVVSSILSKQTGQVGNSTREGVGGAKGFVVREDAKEDDSTGDGTAPGKGAIGWLVAAGVKGSWVMFGKLDGSLFGPAIWKLNDLTKTT